MKNERGMKHTAVRYEFSMKELGYLFFHRKTCPECGGKLVQHKEYETVNGRAWGMREDSMNMIDESRVKRYFYVYSCSRCGVQYSLASLADRKG